MKIEHIAMYVSDLEIIKKFYETYFNAKSSEIYYNRTTGFKSYFLSFEQETRLEIINSPNMVENEKNLKRSGYIHLAFSVGNKEQVDKLTQQLGEAGFIILSEPRTTGDGYYESCILDPEGNQIEITE